MKLLFVHEHLGELGGAEANIHAAAGELGRRGHETGLLYARGTGRNEDGWRETFSKCFQLPARGNVNAAMAVLEEFGPDVLYLHNLDKVEVIAALMESGVPMVRMVHDHSLYCMRGYKYNYLTRQICTRPATPFCVFPCLASVARNRGEGWPLRWKRLWRYEEKYRIGPAERRHRRLFRLSQAGIGPERFRPTQDPDLRANPAQRNQRDERTR